MASPERKFEVGNDYKMSVGSPCFVLLTAHFPGNCERGAVQLSSERTDRQLVTTAST
jgi:hypothetical protein